MIQEAVTMLCQEPWCFTPEEIGKLTDWQIEHLYAKPAARRAEELRKEVPDSPGSRPPKAGAPDPGEPGSPGHRHWHLSAFMNGPMAMSPEKAKAAYEQQLAQWRAQNKG